MDYEYWLRLAKAGVRFAYLNKVLAGSRLYAANKTLGARAKVHFEINNMLRQKFNKVPEVWLSNYAYAVLDIKLKTGRHKFYFRFLVILLTIYAALKWNKSINKKMLLLMLYRLKHA
jgi:hypothetical protein